jgi:histidinol-phosphate aminotransferase
VSDGSRGLLRLPDDVEAYPAEPSDEALAEALGIGLDQLVRFDMNTLGGGPLPGVVRALADYDARRIVEYGDQAYQQLRAALSALTGAPPHRIIPGAGADELIRLATALVVADGDRVTIPVPTFAMFGVEARLAGASVVEVPRRDPGEPQDVASIRAAAEDSGSRLVWLCSPNNPTGDAFSPEDIEQLVDGLPAVVVVDSVYQELAEVGAGAEPESWSLLPLQERHPNLVILRSLAKAYGLAGARVGYLVVPEPMASRFEAARLPLAVGGPSYAAALGALADPAAARERLAEIVAQRQRLAEAFTTLGWRVLPSLANFLLVRPPDAAAVAADLMRRGLPVREYPAGRLAGWLRVTVRAPHENDRLLAALNGDG